MKSLLAKIIISILSLSITTSCYASRVDGPYKGRVIDAETGKPIEGVVVLGTWDREYLSPGGAVHSFYDAQETVTDKNGNFEIKGLGRLIMSNIIPMDVLIFKAGYQPIGNGPWESLSVNGGLLDKKVSWEGDRAIIPLEKLTTEGRRSPLTFPTHPDAPEDKIKHMMNEIQTERQSRGLK